MQAPIKLLQPRDLGQTLNATFAFLKRYFPVMLRPLLILVLPVIIISSVMVMFSFKKLSADPFGATGFSQLGASNILSNISFFLGSILTMLIIAQTFIAVEKSGDGIITSADIMEGVKKNFLRFAGFFLILCIPVFLGIFMVALLSGLMAVVLGKLAPVIMIVFFCGLVYFFIALGMAPFIYLREETVAMAAVTRAFYLIKGYWWRTFGLLLVAMLIAYMLVLVISLPFYAILFTKVFHSVSNPDAINDVLNFSPMQSISFLFVMVGSTLASCIIHSTISFRYYTLVEVKEGESLMSDIYKISEEENQQGQEY